MARGRSRTSADQGEAREVLENPYPSAPARLGKYCIYVTHEVDDYKRLLVKVYYSAYAAKRFVDECVAGKTFKWKKDDTIVVEDGMTIKSSELEELIEHEYTALESEWFLSEEEQKQVGRMRAAVYYPQEKAKALPAPTEKPMAMVSKPKEAKAEKQPRASRDGLIDVGKIAADLNCDPRIARAILRKAKIEKPSAGWAWPSQEAEKIKGLIKKGMK